jgi:hypothetical protein
MVQVIENMAFMDQYAWFKRFNASTLSRFNASLLAFKKKFKNLLTVAPKFATLEAHTV